MKIIEKGNKTPKSEKEYVKTCKNCGCKFVYSFKDTKIAGYWDECSYVIYCPQCNNQIKYPIFKRRYKGDSDE